MKATQSMTESSAFPLRRDHWLARILDDPFALPSDADCPCGATPHIEDPTTNERKSQ